MQPGRDVNQHPASSAADKNEWGHTSLPLYTFMSWTWIRYLARSENREACHKITYVDSQHVSNGVMFGCWISITGSVESSGSHSG